MCHQPVSFFGDVSGVNTCLRIAIGTHTSAAQQNACTKSLPCMFKGYEMIPLMHLAITTFGRKELDLVSGGVGLSRSATFLLGLRGNPHWEESARAFRSQGKQRAPTFSTHGSTGQRSVSKKTLSRSTCC